MQDNISRFPSRSTGEAEQASNRLYARLHNLPAQLTPLVGREHEVEAVSTLLRRPEVRLLTLTGVGGVGKTRLGLHTAAELRAEFASGVYFIPLAPISDPTLVIPTIAQTLDLKETADRPLLEYLKASLHEKHCLLLLDNFEQILTAAPLLVELLQTCPHLKILVTSRAVLHVSGEQEFPVPPLTVPDLKHLPDSETLTQYAAVSLFVQRASAIKPDFQLTSANAHAIAQMCIRLDGLPLAIELAAARIKLLSPQALLTRLSQRLQVLTGGARDAPIRQQTLRNTLAWSYDLLTPEEQRLSRRLCVFVGGCALEAAEVVCNATNDLGIEVLEGVGSLLDKSLLQQTEQEGEEPRLVLLETIREYGLECLAANGEMESTRHAHAVYYLALAEQAEPELSGPQQAMWLERLEQEHDNLRAALSWLLEQGQTNQSRREMALRLGGVLEQFWLVCGHMCGHISEGRTFLERALATSEGVASFIRAKALNVAALLALNQNDDDQAEILAEESLVLFRGLGDQQGIAYARALLGGVNWLRGNLVVARSLLEEAVVIFKEAGNRERSVFLLSNLASIALQQAAYARARALFEESLAIYRELGNKRGIAASLTQLAGTLFLSQGDQARAYSLLEEGLALFREEDDKANTAVSLSLFGAVILQLGDAARARSLAEEGLALNREVGYRLGTAESLSTLARVEAHLGDHAAARVLYEEALTIARERGYKLNIASYLEGLGITVLAQGEPTWAARLWGAAEALREAIGAPIPPVYRAAYDRSVAAARVQLGEKAFVGAWTEGRTMTLEQVLAAQEPATLSKQETAEFQPSTEKAALTNPAGLTERETEVIRLVAQGLTNPQIADHLIVSSHTINAHMRSIFNKLEVNSRSAVTRFAVEHKLV